MIRANNFIIKIKIKIKEFRQQTIKIPSPQWTYQFFPVSTFGFYVGGFLAINITNFSVDNLHEGEDIDDIVVGLSLDKTSNDAQVNSKFEVYCQDTQISASANFDISCPLITLDIGHTHT